MKPPKILPIVASIVQSAISIVDGVTFDGHTVCPACGGPLAGYDTKRKQYAHLLINNEQRTMFASVKRFYCKSCDKLCYADEPFYPNTRMGSAIVDLCVAFSMTMPVNQVPAYLAAMGIIVDRSSCRLYVNHVCSCHVRINSRYLDLDNKLGIHLPISVLSLSSLAYRRDTGEQVDESKILEACSFPSAPRKARNFPLPQKRWINRELY